MITCACDNALPILGALGCKDKENFGQIQKLIFTKVNKADGTKVGFSITKDDAGKFSATKAQYEALLGKTADPRGVLTPYVEAPSQEGGDPITFGGGNDTVGGAEEIVGSNASTFTFALRKWAQAMIKQFKSFGCEPDLGVYFVGEGGNIEGRLEVDSSDVTPTYRLLPFPVRSFFVGDKVHGGLQEPDSNSLQFAMLPNYSDDLVIVATEGSDNILDYVQVK